MQHARSCRFSWGLLREVILIMNEPGDTTAAVEVAGSGLTLLAGIEAGGAPRPELQSWQSWQQWRAAGGKRPRQATEGATTTTAQESALWRKTMAALYGEQWQATLSTATPVGGEEPAASSAETGRSAPQASGAPTVPAGVAAAGPAIEGRGSQASGAPTVPAGIAAAASEAASAPSETGASSPGSGRLLSSAGRSPGSGSQSGSSRGTGSTPSTPTRIGQAFSRPHDPLRESVEAFEARLTRQAASLAAFGFTLAEGTVEVRVLKARLAEEIRNAAETAEDQVRLLKREYAVELLDGDSGGEPPWRRKALEELLEARGVETVEVRTRLLRGEPAATPTPEPRRASTFTVHTPPSRVLDDHTPAGSPEVEDLRRRLERAEVALAAERLATPPRDSGAQIAEALERGLKAQAEALASASSRNQNRGSTIRVEPKLSWPKLGDDGPGGARSRSSTRSWRRSSTWRTMDKA